MPEPIRTPKRLRPTDAAQVTAFQRRVYAALLLIPRGRVVTYKALADHLGCGSCQAIGQALRRNPFAPRVPCHRVIAADLTVGGFAGARQGSEIRRKLRLLGAEGVEFRQGRLADPSRLLIFRASSGHPEA